MKNSLTLEPSYVFAKNEHAALCFEMNSPIHSEVVSDFRLDEGAVLDLILIQGGHTDQMSKLKFTLGRNAKLNSIVFTHSQATAKNEIFVDFAGEGGSASLRGLSLLGGKGQARHSVTANHRVGHCTSDQFYKSILAGEARSDFDSLVHVHEGASGSDSRQLCKNLLLSDKAKGYAKPQLKILTDDVSCKHGATTGQLEKNELFYLRSRGLAKETAQFVLMDGFAEEVFDVLPSAPAKKELKALVKRELTELVKT